MHVHSRQSLASALEALEGVIGEVADPAALAGEFFAIADLLGANASLRRRVLDASRPGSDRAGLLRSLLGSQVSQIASELAGSVVATTWSRASDLVAAINELGDQTLLAGAEAAGVLDAVDEEVFRFARIVEHEPALSAALADPSLPAEQKVRLLEGLLSGKVAPQTLALIERAVNGRRSVPIDRALLQITEMAAARRARRIATVTSAVELTADQRDRLADKLSSSYGIPLQLQVEVDPTLVGGLVVKVGDDLIDGSIARRLDMAARAVTR